MLNIYLNLDLRACAPKGDYGYQADRVYEETYMPPIVERRVVLLNLLFYQTYCSVQCSLVFGFFKGLHLI